jgi:ribonuclease P protein component
MLPKSQRLNLAKPGNQDFYRSFRVVTLPSLKVYWERVLENESPKQAVVVGRKVSLLAVVRNVIKRQNYDLVQELLHKNSLQNYHLVVVVTRKVEREQYLAELTKAFQQLKTLS